MMRRTWLKQLRYRKEWSQENIAFDLHISQQYYNFIENGKRNLNIHMALRLAEIFNVPVSWIFDQEIQSQKKAS